MSSTFMTAAWRKLIMAQYEVTPDTLQPFLPAGTELDLYDGRCFVSLIGFLFTDIRLKGWRIPFHGSFEEINLRFYVRHRDRSGTSHRGVVFLQELVPRFAVTTIANTVYGEAYKTRSTRHTWHQTPDRLAIEYGWRWRKTWSRLAVEASPIPQPISPGSIEEFITEHYWGFTRRSPQRTSGYEVAHPRWHIYPVRSHVIELDFAAQYGPAFAHLQTRQPDSILLAEGSEVTIQSGAAVEIGHPSSS